MPVLVVSNPKGGTGKSTTSLVLATTLARHGASVTLFDCDPNRHLVAWKSGPTKSAVQVVGHAEATNIARMLKSEAASRQFVIADLEGTASLLVASAILAADLVIGGNLDLRVRLTRSPAKVLLFLRFESELE